MQICTYCERYFKSRQAVRGHLRACRSYKTALADGRTVRKPRVVAVELHVCGGCGHSPSDDGVPVTMAAIHESWLEGCPRCGSRQWQAIGKRRAPVT